MSRTGSKGEVRTPSEQERGKHDKAHRTSAKRGRTEQANATLARRYADRVLHRGDHSSGRAERRSSRALQGLLFGETQAPPPLAFSAAGLTPRTATPLARRTPVSDPLLSCPPLPANYLYHRCGTQRPDVGLAWLHAIHPPPRVQPSYTTRSLQSSCFLYA